LALAVLASVQTISMSLLPVLNALGVTELNSETLGLLTVLIGTVVASVGSVFTAYYMEARVTPISDPMTTTVTRLVAGDNAPI
jgi:hypothetical protein